MPGVELRHGWVVSRISEMARLVNGYPFASELFTPDGEVPLVRIRDITAAVFETFVPRDAVPQTAWIQNNDLVIGMDGDFNAAIWRRKPAALNQRVCLLRPRPGNDIRFIAYLLPEMLRVVNDLAYATTVKHLSSGDVTSQHVARPNFEWQRQIADYLDTQTAKIDALIGKQERLIETLAERRLAVISHAVTKGLDPNVTMKEIGLSMISEIPAHWEMRKLRALSTVISKGTTPSTIGETYQDEGIRFVRGEDLQAGAVGAERPTFISEATNATLKRSQLRVGDVLFVIAGTLGKCAIVASKDLPANTNQAIAFIRPRQGEASRFLWYWLTSAAVAAMTSLSSVTSAQPNLSMENLGNFPVPVMSTSERASIIQYLDRETAQTDALSAKAREMIDVLKERRQALISAAVTGKIDVRGLA